MSRMPLLSGAVRWISWIIPVLTSALLMTLIGLLVWCRIVTVANASARFALDSDEAVLVSQNDWITFQPRDVDPVTGVIFYPGARAEPAGYAPILHQLAARGFLVVMTPMPLNLAILAPERAGRVMTRYADIARWVIAGHGLGGLAAAEFAGSHEAKVAGLMLWEVSLPGFSNLSDSGIAALLLFAAPDAQSIPAGVEKSRKRLPVNSRLVPIEGGDPWGFGDFATDTPVGSQSKKNQHAEILDASQAFLESLSAEPGNPDDS